MQVNGTNLQKVRVKLSREALTIQKEGGGVYCSPHINQLEVRNILLDVGSLSVVNY